MISYFRVIFLNSLQKKIVKQTTIHLMKSKIISFLFIPLMISCTGKYYSAKDFGSVKKIDSHIHINSDDGVFEKQAASDNFILITLNVDNSDSASIRKQYDYAKNSAVTHPGKIFYAPTFLFDTTGWGTKEWSNKVISKLSYDMKGAVGVKIWKNIGMTVRDRNGRFIMADDPGLDRVFEFIRSKNIPVAAHLGEPRNCWLPLDEMTVSSDSSYFASNPQYHMFLHPEYPSYEDQIKARDNLLRKNPELNFIGCHLGSLEWNVDSIADRLDRFPNLVVDMSARICHLQYQSARDRDKVRNFCIKYQDRLLYGTDTGYSGKNPAEFSQEMHNTWLADWKYFTSDEDMNAPQFRGNFRGLKLPREIIDKIYFANAVKWYKIESL